jgi:hypothetical protein
MTKRESESLELLTGGDIEKGAKTGAKSYHFFYCGSGGAAACGGLAIRTARD